MNGFFFFFPLSLSFVLSSFLMGLGLWLFVGLSICGFEGDGDVRLGFGLVWVCRGSYLFVGLREMAGRQ